MLFVLYYNLNNKEAAKSRKTKNKNGQQHKKLFTVYAKNKKKMLPK